MRSRRLSIALALLAAAILSQACDTATSGTSSSSGSAYTLSDGSVVTTTGTAYSSTASDESAILVTSGTLNLTNPTITKSGDISSGTESKKGTNAAVLASSSSAAIAITGGSISSSATGGNAAFAYNGATLSLDGTTIACTGTGDCRALYATYAGVISATSVTATTTGKNSSVVATDMGGGTIALTGGSFAASGADSAGLYSTGTVTGSGITASSAVGEACVIEGSNSIALTGSSVLASGAGNRGIMMLQSGSGDAGSGYNASFSMKGGSISTTTKASTNSSNTFSALVPVFEVVCNATGTIALTDVAVTSASGLLMEVDYNTRWSTSGATGNLVLASSSGSYAVSGDVIADSYSAATVSVGSGVTWTGSFDSSNSAKSGSVTIASGGTWVLSGNSYVDSLTNGGTVTKGAYTLYVNGSAI